MPTVNPKRADLRAGLKTHHPVSSSTSTVSSRGQIVIPAPLRHKYRLEEGMTVIFHEMDGHIVLEPDRFAAFRALRGTLPAAAERDLIEEREKEREREDRQR